MEQRLQRSTTLGNQLATPGRVFISVGVYMQDVRQVDKDENNRGRKKTSTSVYCLFCRCAPKLTFPWR
jgi:hypothetical protein